VHLLSVSVIALACAGAADADKDAAKKELAKMQGEWRLVRGEENGEPAPDYAVKNLKCRINDDQMTFEGLEPLTDRASKLTITIDAGSTPKCIDLKVEAGDEKGGVYEGVYEFKGEELKLRLNLTRGDRPVDFETKGGANRVLFVLKQEKK
jgi:uncharacterized protein (TIGR03067 family)